MFWKFNLLTTSHIDTLLDKEDVTLHELMDEDDILQECKAQNRKLINFLVLPENMEELVRLITEEPAEDVEEKIRYKYPNTACELLTSDVSQINDALAGSDELVKKLYAFLDTDKTLNPLLASFFSKVMGLLITRKSEMILEFLQTRADFVGTLLKHIGTSAIMDLLLRLLTCIESPEIRRAMIEWLNEQQIVQKLVNCIHKDYDEDIHCNAAQSLCDIIRLGREQVIQLQDRADPDPLLTTVEMEDNVSKMLGNMLNDEEKNESVIVNGLSVIQTLLEFKKQGPEDSVEQMTTVDAEQMFLGVNNVLTAICPRLKDFHTILVEPPKQRFSVMPSTAGPLAPPLGNTRLQTGRLVASLLLTNTHSINIELAQLGTINVLIDLYFNYIWNNFLHTHVTQCLYTILSNPPIDVDGKKECPLLNQLFSEYKLVQRILDEWDTNDQDQSKEGGRRKGFMGHLTRLANDVVNAQEKGENAEAIKTLITDLPEELKEKWETFLTGTLTETNKRNTVELVQGHGLASSSEDDDADFSNIPFPQDTAMQQAFSDYQLQQMTSNFIDQFGFNEDEFGEHEEKTDSPFTDRISSIDFGGTVNEDVRPNASRFEQYCNERLQQFDNDSDEDIWEEKEITFSPSSQQKRSERLPVTRGSQDDSDSTDSEEELDSPKRILQQPGPTEKMDVDSNEAWTANFEQQQQQQTGSTEGGPIAMDTSPWDSNTTDKPAQSDNWANFEKASEGEKTKSSEDSSNKDNWADFTNFDNIKSEGSEAEPRSSSPVAMDTTEPSSRTNAYLASNKEMDLKLESVDTTTDEDLGTDVDKLVEKNSDSDSSAKQEQSNTDTSSEKSDNVNKETDSQSASQSSSQSPSVNKSESQSSQDTTQKVTQSNIPEKTESPLEKPPTPPSSPLPDEEGNQQVPQSPRSPPAPSTDCDSEKPNLDTNAQGDGCNTSLNEQQESADDDLSSNFNFLTKVGLLKPAGAPNCVSPSQSDIQGNGPTKDTPDISTDKLEELRTQAKDALESFDTAIQSGANVQNGPV